MKIANLDGRAVLITATGAIDIFEATAGEFGPSLHSIFDRWEQFVPAAAGIEADAIPYEDERLGPPSPTPRQVFAIGLNYRAHAEESNQQLPSMPATFTKFPSALNGPFHPIELPGVADTVDWEVELVVVIGRVAADVDRADAWDYVAGLTVGQDISERTTQMAAGRQFSLGKSFRTFAPTGPWIVTLDEIDDRDDLALGCSIDGETVQSSSTSDLIFPVDDLIARLSAIVTLYPGDLIFTGTPAGVGAARTPPRFLAAGQVLETWVDGIGRLRNPVRTKGS